MHPEGTSFVAASLGSNDLPTRAVRSIGSRLAPSLLLMPLTVAAALLAGAAGLTGQEIDRSALMRDMSVLAHDSMQGRRVGTPESALARGWIMSRLRGMGLSPREQSFEAREGSEGVNVIAEIPGRGGAVGRIVLTAHYDHLGVRGGEVFNGADDNASGTAGVLAIASVLAHAPLEHDLTIILFDAEEGGLRGARAYVESLQASGELSQLALNLNLDMVSRSEESLWVTGTHQKPFTSAPGRIHQPGFGVVLRFGHDTDDLPPADNWGLRFGSRAVSRRRRAVSVLWRRGSSRLSRFGAMTWRRSIPSGIPGRLRPSCGSLRALDAGIGSGGDADADPSAGADVG